MTSYGLLTHQHDKKDKKSLKKDEEGNDQDTGKRIRNDKNMYKIVSIWGHLSNYRTFCQDPLRYLKPLEASLREHYRKAGYDPDQVWAMFTDPTRQDWIPPVNLGTGATAIIVSDLVLNQ